MEPLHGLFDGGNPPISRTRLPRSSPQIDVMALPAALEVAFKGLKRAWDGPTFADSTDWSRLAAAVVLFADGTGLWL